MITHNITNGDEPYGLDGLESSGVVEVWYEYQDGGYDGMGHAVVKFADGTFDVIDLGHCSCYGPFDNWTPGPTYHTADELKASMEYARDIELVLTAAGLV